MTQDEREQKALEQFLREYRANYDFDPNIGDAFRGGWSAAMTEGGVWISREDLADLSNDAYKWLSDKAEKEKVMADIAFEESVGSIAVDMPALEIRCFVDRLRAKLAGQKP